ncbi:MAG: SCO1664 family protein [Actinomycetota bacterium]|nr:SCO1664 family protein [Actinomycetota bacterium]
MTTRLELLERGSLELEGRLLSASNATFVGEVTLDGVTASCVYKPIRGERTLWDFPEGTLAHRERAAYLVSVATGVPQVPPTVLRAGPFGPGMCQLWIDEDAEQEMVDVVPAGEVPDGWLHVLDAEDHRRRAVSLVHRDDPGLQLMVVLDAVINNADRKGGHVLVDARGRMFGVDHGVCFHHEDKLRTVLWGWAGEQLPEACRELLHRLRAALDADLSAELGALLTRDEVTMTCRRVERLLAAGRFPTPSASWPAIPWPAF